MQKRNNRRRLKVTGEEFCNIFFPYSDSRGNGSFRSYSRSDPGSFRSNSLSVRSFRPGSFRPDLRGGSFRPNFGGSFRPTLFYIVFR